MAERPAAPKPSKIYKSAFDKWDKASWVRSKPHQQDLAAFRDDLDFFPEQLAILFQSEAVRKCPAPTRSKILPRPVNLWVGRIPGGTISA